MDGIMWAVAKNKIEWNEELYFAMKCARKKLSKSYSEVTLTTGPLLMSVHILDPFQKLQSFRKWDIGIDINYDDKDSYPRQYQAAFWMYMENEYWAKHQWLSDNQPERVERNIILSDTACCSGQSSYDQYDSSSDDDEYLKSKNVAKMTPGHIDRAALLLTAAGLFFNSPPYAPTNWGQMNPNLNEYHSDPFEITSPFWLSDNTNWWYQQEETLSKYADLSIVERGIMPIKPHCVGVGASFSFGRDMVGWRQSKTIGEALRETRVVKLYSRAYNWTLAVDNPVWDTT